MLKPQKGPNRDYSFRFSQAYVHPQAQNWNLLCCVMTHTHICTFTHTHTHTETFPLTTIVEDQAVIFIHFFSKSISVQVLIHSMGKVNTLFLCFELSHTNCFSWCFITPIDLQTLASRGSDIYRI